MNSISLWFVVICDFQPHCGFHLPWQRPRWSIIQRRRKEEEDEQGGEIQLELAITEKLENFVIATMLSINIFSNMILL